MSLLNKIFDWQTITYTLPFVGILLCFFLLISHKICTRRIAVSTAIALFLLLWLLLTWADWGSVVYVPSYQILWVRVIMLIIAALIIFELRALRFRIIKYKMINARLEAQNSSLIENLIDLNKGHDHG